MIKIKVFEECVSELSKLPGIGRKTSIRLAMHMLKMKKEDVLKLASKIVNYREGIVFCEECGGIAEDLICPICKDVHRSKDIICVVEEAKDVFVLEQIGYFKGVYHVLGGKISPLDGLGPDDLKIKELFERVERYGVKEVVLATNSDMDGETTAIFLMRSLKKFPKLKVTKLASGIPLGTHIEYADEMTVLRAFESRREF